MHVKKNDEALAHLVAMLHCPCNLMQLNSNTGFFFLLVYCMVYDNVTSKIVPHKYRTIFGRAADLSIDYLHISLLPKLEKIF